MSLASKLGVRASRMVGARRLAPQVLISNGPSPSAFKTRSSATFAEAEEFRAGVLSFRNGAERHRENGLGLRAFSMSSEDVDQKMQDINIEFVEARELIQDALDAQGSTYFEEDLKDAQDQVCRVLGFEFGVKEWGLAGDCAGGPGTKPHVEELSHAVFQVAKALEMYNDLLAQLDEKKKGEIQRLMGMKMEQLKGELQQILTSLTLDEDLPESGRKE
eukprot:CAMPEP_0184289918 /NCGR_PEP_ID=MMETSP1049-20130417/2286_1 /TAXON_ID=77928 /ORGANISM="Proteomonas sulcata, Strain CCMP704" /LENGTH=217 /DNA_ID=CAMNT_0026596905 /DNA_START=47 /DNA_END=701 /DNA_ORIENTATION=-